MTSFWGNVLILSFAIFGMIKLIEDVWLDVCCFLVIGIIKFKKYIKNLLINDL